MGSGKLMIRVEANKGKFVPGDKDSKGTGKFVI